MKLMLLHFLQALRSMRRNFLQTFLSWIGLVIGLSAFVFGYNWYWYETNYDSPSAVGETVYAVYSKDADRQIYNYSCPNPMYYLLRDTLSGVKEAALFGGGSYPSEMWDEENRDLMKMNPIVSVASPELLSFMNIKMLTGDARTALNRKDAIVLSREAAFSIFKRENVAGEVLKLKFEPEKESRVFTVTGVAEIPEHSSIGFQLLISMENLGESALSNWNNYTSLVCFKTDNIAKIKQGLASRSYFNPSFSATTLSDTHFLDWKSSRWEGLMYPLIFLGISALLLFSALFNYSSILTTQFMGRFQEYRLRISLGGTFLNNLFWLYGEVLILFILSAFGSGFILELVKYSSREYYFNMTLLNTFYKILPFYLLGLGVVALLPVYSLHRTYQRSLEGKKNIRSIHTGMLSVQMLVCACFAFLFVNTCRQFYFMTHASLGFNHERVIRLFTRDTPFNSALNESLLQELRSYETGCIEDVVGLPSSIFQSRQYGGAALTRDNNEEESVKMAAITVPPKAFHFFGIHPTTGTIYGQEESGGRKQVMLNKDAAEMIQYTPDSKAQLSINGQPIEVTGVVDFYARTFHEKKQFPVLYFFTDREADGVNHEVIFVRYKKGKYEEAMQLIRTLLEKRQIPLEHLELSGMDTYITQFYEEESWMMKLASAIFGSSILITLFGLFSQISYILRKERKFIAIRRIFGADHWVLCRKYLRNYVLLILISCILMFPVAIYFLHIWLMNYRSHINVGWFESFWIGGLLVLLVVLVVSFCLRNASRENPADVMKDGY